MGAGNSSLVRDSQQLHVDAGHQDGAASTTRPEAWADFVSLILLALGHHSPSVHLPKFGHMQDHKLRTGSIARTKERIQCICEGACFSGNRIFSCKFLTVTNFRFTPNQEGISVKAKILVVNRLRALSRACIPAGLQYRCAHTAQPWKRSRSTQNSLTGLCCWQVLAMARPWQENLIANKLPKTMHAAGIGMILNLQVSTFSILFVLLIIIESKIPHSELCQF